MAQFRIFLIGCREGALIDLPVSSLCQVNSLARDTRFLTGELIDVVDENGVCSNRRALIPISRIQMILEDAQ